MNLNKESFLQMGFDVYESPTSLIVTTPQTFASGDPAHFWVKNAHNKILFNDYGSSLNSLELSLPNPDNAYHILQSILKKLESPIELDGTALVREATESQVTMAISDYINLYALLTTYRPRNAKEQDVLEILDNIYHYLTARFDEVLVKVKYKGLSGNDHKFAFQAKNQVYDYAKATKQSTGSLLRKIMDVSNIYDDLDFNIVLDDSDEKQFEKEARILSTVANIKPYSLMLAS